MGRKPKSEATVTVSDEDIHGHHARLLSKLDELREKRDFFQSHEGEAFVREISKHIDGRLAELAEDNLDTGTATKAVVVNMGRAAALEEIRGVIKGSAWDDQIEDAERELETFEEANSLLLIAKGMEEAQA